MKSNKLWSVAVSVVLSSLLTWLLCSKSSSTAAVNPAVETAPALNTPRQDRCVSATERVAAHNHTFIAFTGGGGYGSLAVVHDPDCACYSMP